MSELNENIVAQIESMYESFTPTEKEVATFFIHSKGEMDFSSKRIAQKIHVSEASLTRFAKKCGYSGYREFVFDYQMKPPITRDHHPSQHIKRVLYDYNDIVDKTYSLSNVNQLERLVKKIVEGNYIYLYGKGSSGLAATEMKIRFMRLGIKCEVITDDDVMKVNHVLLDEGSVVIGFSLSGKSKIVLESLYAAVDKQAYTVLVTTQKRIKVDTFVNEVIAVASVENLDYGNRVSPQLPLLILIDILYDSLIEVDHKRAEKIFRTTLDPFRKEERT